MKLFLDDLRMGSIDKSKKPVAKKIDTLVLQRHNDAK